MQFSEMQTEVFRRLNESSSDPAYWTVDDVKAAINDGYESISDAAEWFTSWVFWEPDEETTYFDLELLPEYSFIRVSSIYNNLTSRWLVPSSIRELDNSMRPRWENVTGPPERYFFRSPYKIGIYPKTAEDTLPAASTLTLYFTCLPDRLEQDGDTPKFLQELHFGLIEYALYDLLVQDGETELALDHWNKYLEYEDALTKLVQLRTRDRVGGLRE